MATIHRGIGIGGSRLVTWLLGGPPDRLEAITDEHQRLFLAQQERLRPTSGARALLDDLATRQIPTVIATSAGAPIRAALMETLGNPSTSVTDADAVDDAKPAADLLQMACEVIDVAPERAVLIGDSLWDVAAARRIGIQMMSVRTGGFGDATLAARGPTAVVDAPVDLIGTL